MGSKSPAHPALGYYITAHGYGHGVRSCDIIRSLMCQCPLLQVHVVSDLPVAFLRNRLASAGICFRPGAFDVGMVQIDSIRVNVPATLGQVEALYVRRQKLITQEAAFMEAQGLGVVVSDIPALPLEAAAQVGIPGIAVGNFDWDWIYSGYLEQDPRWDAIVRAFKEGYAKADLLLRLPFSDEMKAFPRIEDIPVVASPGRSRRREIAELTGCRSEHKWILLSFTDLQWDAAALDRVERLEAYEFFTVLPLAWQRKNIHAIDREQIRFSDVLASVDGVVSKPGFGILSECALNRKPLVYAERTDFREYLVLERAIPRYLKHVHIPAAKLYCGDLIEALEKLGDLPEPPFSIPQGGAEVAARRILSLL